MDALTELDLIIFFTKDEVMTFYPECPTKILYVEPRLTKNPKHLKILASVCKFLAKTNSDPWEYVDFVVNYYNKSKYKQFPLIPHFNIPKVKKLFLKAQENPEAIRFMFKPVTVDFDGTIFDPDTKKYYGFYENKLVNAVKSDYRYTQILSWGIRPFLRNENPPVTMELLRTTEILLASALLNRKVYAEIIPNLYKYWKYAVYAPKYIYKTVELSNKKFQQEFEME